MASAEEASGEQRGGGGNRERAFGEGRRGGSVLIGPSVGRTRLAGGCRARLHATIDTGVTQFRHRHPLTQSAYRQRRSRARRERPSLLPPPGRTASCRLLTIWSVSTSNTSQRPCGPFRISPGRHVKHPTPDGGIPRPPALPRQLPHCRRTPRVQVRSGGPCTNCVQIADIMDSFRWL